MLFSIKSFTKTSDDDICCFSKMAASRRPVNRKYIEFYCHAQWVADFLPIYGFSIMLFSVVTSKCLLVMILLCFRNFIKIPIPKDKLK